MANRFIKYRIEKEDPESGLILCRRNILHPIFAPEGYYYRTKSGKILGNVVFIYDNRLKDFTGELDLESGNIPEEEYELVKEE